MPSVCQEPFWAPGTQRRISEAASPNVGDPSNWTAQGIVGRRAQGGDIREGFPQEAWQELNDKEISQPMEGLERREGWVHRGVRVGCTPATVGGLHALLLLQCSSGRCLPKVTSDFLGSSSDLNLFIFHILTRAVIAATHSLVHELLYLLTSGDSFLWSFF